MSQEYIYACQRAELLGLPTPSEEEWAKSQKDIQRNLNEELEDEEDRIAVDLDQKDESLRGVTGGLDELNSILNATQKKINRFKTVCGSLTNILKVRVSSRNGTPDHRPLKANPDAEEATPDILIADENITVETTEQVDQEDPGNSVNSKSAMTGRKIDINQKVESHIDKLDSLITKAEKAQYSMQCQTKEMKKFLK
ncbi:uncharacterized protein LOC107274295 [Cephus cinctus]|uniref:Uncharacterized protein LOC107274295 n=1 Tax=Cephus cinctus TaxID=211228 RepID=A0AAJ7CFJ4_CEPCN|nr:uncharacterized protein LOC107274295 [Cephus cinctus]